MSTVSAARLQTLRSVFGVEVPKDPGLALGILESSPAAPSTPAELQALRELVLALAGQRLDAAEQAAKAMGGAPASSAARRPLPAAMALRLQEALAAQKAHVAGEARALEPALPLAVAEQIFRELASGGIPWSFVADGCFFRAHTVCKALEERGFFSEKVWALTRGGDLVIKQDKSSLGYSVVVNHVAACIHVELPDGTRARRVIDPSVADGLLTVEEWQGNMRSAHDPGTDLLFMPRFMMMLWEREKPPTTWKPRDLEEAQAWHDGGWRESEKGYREMGYFKDPFGVMAGG